MEIAAVLEEGQRLGLVGPGPVARQIDHAAALCRLVQDRCGEPLKLLDLGSGAGLPGLVAARYFGLARVTLLDSRARSTRFLEYAVAQLHLEPRVEVLQARAEVVSHEEDRREQYSVVMARAVAPAPVVVELGAALVALGGCLLVSERPGGGAWDADRCRELGLVLGELETTGESSARILHKRSPTPAQWPRRTGVPAKRPLW